MNSHTTTPINQVNGNLLVFYSTTRTGLSTTHERITKENCTSTGADPKALRTVAKLFDSKNTTIGKILSLFAQTLKDIANKGLRLSTGGYLVRADRLEDVMAIFDEADDKLDELKKSLRAEYPELVRVSKDRLGSAAQDIVFPTVDEALARFSHKLDFTPDPTAGSILLEGVSEEAAAKARAQLQESRDNTMLDAQENLVKELLGFVTGTGESDQGIIGVLGSDCRVYQSRFQKLKDRIEVAKSYNWVTNTEAFDQAIDALERIADTDVESIRGSDPDAKVARRDVELQAKAAVTTTKDLLDSFGVKLTH